MDKLDCCRIFGQRSDHPEQVELMGLFAEALVDLGRFVSQEYGGSFLAVVEAASGSAERLAQSLLKMDSYRDRWPLGGVDVYFYKRAQITAADLARAFGDEWPADFNDLDLLTAFADNLVPHVLRVDGILHYDDDLAAHIDAGLQLEPGSRAEIEIRAHGVEAVEQLVTELRNAGHHIRAMDVDLALWTRGAAKSYKAIPRHRTRCTFY